MHDQHHHHDREGQNINVYFHHVCDPHVAEALRGITRLLENIMSAIGDFSAKVTAHNDKMDAAIAGLQSDVEALNTKIAELQATAGTVTPEDQALLDAIETRASGIADRLDALDALTPPPAPPVP
jgi:peptidoglycan hydrolase CwlO-like protein